MRVAWAENPSQQPSKNSNEIKGPIWLADSGKKQLIIAQTSGKRCALHRKAAAMAVTGGPRRAVLYLRVSTDRQTVENQRQSLEAIARAIRIGCRWSSAPYDLRELSSLAASQMLRPFGLSLKDHLTGSITFAGYARACHLIQHRCRHQADDVGASALAGIAVRHFHGKS